MRKLQHRLVRCGELPYVFGIVLDHDMVGRTFLIKIFQLIVHIRNFRAIPPSDWLRIFLRSTNETVSKAVRLMHGCVRLAKTHGSMPASILVTGWRQYDV